MPGETNSADSQPHEVTRLLDAIRRQDDGAHDKLLEAVYDELHGIARRQLGRESRNMTLQPTALVSEAYIRLFGDSDGSFENRRHFFGAAAIAMHRICVDYARRRRSLKRGGGVVHAETHSDTAYFDRDPVEVLALDEALVRLGDDDPTLVELIRLRYFVGLSLDETAEVLGIARRTVAKRWRLARGWLFEELNGDNEM